METQNEPIIKDVNLKKTLLNAVTINGITVSEINVEKLILRPVIKRIVFITKELQRVIIYDGEDDYEAHKNDSDDILIVALLSKIDSAFK